MAQSVFNKLLSEIEFDRRIVLMKPVFINLVMKYICKHGPGSPFIVSAGASSPYWRGEGLHASEPMQESAESAGGSVEVTEPLPEQAFWGCYGNATT